MSLSTKLAPRLRPIWSSVATSSSRGFTSTPSRTQEEWPQRTPLGIYYESVLNNKSPYPFKEKPEEPPNSADPDVLPPGKEPVSEPAPPSPRKKPGRKPSNDASAPSSSQTALTDSSKSAPPEPSPPPASAQEKARIIFGSRLLGPTEQADRLAMKKAKSTYVAGVLVPPKPEEPDNCCMSGCVNCVWDRYREEMEEWTAKKHEVEARMQESAESVEADGGGSEAGLGGVDVSKTKIAKDMWDEEVYENVPLGIREFMKQEKRLKERHEREGTVGG